MPSFCGCLCHLLLVWCPDHTLTDDNIVPSLLTHVMFRKFGKRNPFSLIFIGEFLWDYVGHFDIEYIVCPEFFMHIVINRPYAWCIDWWTQRFFYALLEHWLRIAAFIAFSTKKYEFCFITVSLLLQENLLWGRMIKKSACIKWFMHMCSIPQIMGICSYAWYTICMTINADWHKAHKMPKNPTHNQRLLWHREHLKYCACRKPSPKLLEALHSLK